MEVSGIGNAGPSSGYAESGEDKARVELVLEKLFDQSPSGSREPVASGGGVTTKLYGSVMGGVLEVDGDPECIAR